MAAKNRGVREGWPLPEGQFTENSAAVAGGRDVVGAGFHGGEGCQDPGSPLLTYASGSRCCRPGKPAAHVARICDTVVADRPADLGLGSVTRQHRAVPVIASPAG